MSISTVNPEVLVVTSSADDHANIVCTELHQRKVPFVRLDTDKFLDNPFHWDLNSNHLPISVGGTCLLRSPRTVWYRKPVPPISAKRSGGITEQFLYEEHDGLVHALLQIYPQSRWINSPSSVQVARRKLDQIRQAQVVGLTVPRSLLSNKKEDISAFYSVCNNNVVIKPIQAQYLDSGGEGYAFGTRMPSQEEAVRSALHCPSFLQERLPHSAEVRVVAFGEDLHAFRMTSNRDVDDIKRLELEEISHQPIDIPDDIAHGIKLLMRYYNLEFCAPDFLETEKGLIFLELNPNGQWMWLQYVTEHNLLDPFLKFLLR